MMQDIIWATVAAYTVGAAVWLVHNLVTAKTAAQVEARLDEAHMHHAGRIDILEKALLSEQRELVNVRDAVTRIENRLSPDNAGPRLAKRWPGEA